MSAADVGVEGWIVRDESSVNRCHLTPGHELGPGRPLSITSADPCWEPGGSPVWNNGGDLVMVLDANGRVVANSRYRD